MSRRILDSLQNLRIRRAACRQARHTDSVRPVIELRRPRDLRDVPVRQIFGRFRNNIIKHFHMADAKPRAMARRFTRIRVPKSEITGIDAGNDLTDKLSVHGGRHIQRCNRIPKAVDAVGHADFAPQFADNTGHAGLRHRFNLRQIRHTEFIGEHDAVHAAVLQRTQVLISEINHLPHTALFVIIRVTGHRLQVAHRNHRFLHPEHLFKPAHFCFPFSDKFL